ncbi:MAG: ABC transporter ATP-binding protein [Deltaproteobacteria bacterium]|nr:ABC transporter ATP-binding protein [Deltaproteobacteria bacterium]
MQDAVEITDLTFSYRPPKAVLDVAQLNVARGEKVFLHGPSGCGKTTLLGILAGVLQAKSGSVKILGHDLARLSGPARDRVRGAHIGYIFQMFNLIPYLSVLDNITLPCRISGGRSKRLNGKSAVDEARALAGALGIDNLIAESVVDLSVGQQQRVAAARALIGAPELIIADEPTSALDEDHRENFLTLLFKQCAAIKSTLVFVSHDRRMMPLFDRAVSLREVNRA